jgi:sacsin
VIGKNGGEDTLAHWPIASGLNIEECTCEILKYLDKIWDSLSPSGASLLSRYCIWANSDLTFIEV